MSLVNLFVYMAAGYFMITTIESLYVLLEYQKEAVPGDAV